MKEQMMPNELPPSDSERNDSKHIWLSQPTEITNMTSTLVQLRARDLRARTRRKLAGTLAGPLVAGFFCAYGVKEFAELRSVLAPISGVALVWSLAGLYFLNRGMWSAAMPERTGASAGLEFCRRELERQRDLVRRVLLWSFGPVILAIGAFILALAMVSQGVAKDSGLFPNALPFLIAIVVWIVAYFCVRWREQRRLQDEIDELNEIEREKRDL
jgi:hypothetical protein